MTKVGTPGAIRLMESIPPAVAIRRRVLQLVADGDVVYADAMGVSGRTILPNANQYSWLLAFIMAAPATLSVRASPSTPLTPRALGSTKRNDTADPKGRRRCSEHLRRGRWRGRSYP